ncbi:methionine--tRNA ligase [Patescibacteria group bacterium]|nr:methionine--tRNA ligase [Patescibacteria group bacterium]
MNKGKFYITTAIPYVNAAPHIGFALEAVQGDVMARYSRQKGVDTYLLTGADENSLKNVKAAEEAGVSTQHLCDTYAKEFADLKSILNFSYNYFFRSSSKKNHWPGVQKLWKLAEKDIFKKPYKGLYCVGCELFYTKNELIDGKCPEHKTKVELVSEENYFFKLSKYESQLKELIKSDELKIVPQERKNEVLGFINQGLEDFSISRSVKRAKGWGVEVPGDSKQIMYVWFDALGIYLTGIGYGTDEKKFKKWWPANIHLIGKGILRFHAVYWPAILLSAGLPLPKSIYVHGYLTVEGEKISKSVGNVTHPNELVDKYGRDPVRYFLLKDIPFGNDGDFSIERFEEVYNADLANGLGNLVSRVSKLLEINNVDAGSIKRTTKKFSPELEHAIENLKFNEALNFIWENIRAVDLYIEKERPWEISDLGIKVVLETLVNRIEEIAFDLKPFLPETSEKITKQFSGPKIKSEKPLFPRIK